MVATRARAIALTAAASAGASTASVRAQARASIHVAVVPSEGAAEVFYAKDMGFFTKAGLNIDMTSFASGAQILTAAGGNAVDIGLSNTANLANAIAHGAPFTIIAGAGLYTAAHPTVELMVPLNSPLRTAKDLVGKTISVTALKDLTEVGTRAWLRRNGVDPNTVKFVELPMAQMPAGLDRGTFDAGIVAEPFLSGVRKTLRVLGSPYDAIGPQFLIANWFSSTDYVKKNPDIIKRFVAATYETARWANANHAASGKILAKWGKMDPALFDTMTRCEYATSLDPKYIDPVLDAMYRYEAIDKHLTTADLVTKIT